MYAIPPFTAVKSLDFDDHPFEIQQWDDVCELCESADSFLDEVIIDDAGTRMFVCSDSYYCEQQKIKKEQRQSVLLASQS